MLKVLNKSGVVKDLSHQGSKREVRVLVVQESNWNGCEVSDMRSYITFESGKLSNKHELGVTFIVHRDFKANVVDFKPIHKRLCALRIKTKFFNIWLVIIHAQIEEKNDEVKEQFYDDLGRLCIASE